MDVVAVEATCPLPFTKDLLQTSPQPQKARGIATLARLDVVASAPPFQITAHASRSQPARRTLLEAACGWTIEDAIAWVRAHYCPRAIETRQQENFIRMIERKDAGHATDNTPQATPQRRGNR